ncbi:MAG: hypothetical protein PVF83_11450 [Anaerolineales bacterium]|jgi:hypothetical protein
MEKLKPKAFIGIIKHRLRDTESILFDKDVEELIKGSSEHPDYARLVVEAYQKQRIRIGFIVNLLQDEKFIKVIGLEKHQVAVEVIRNWEVDESIQKQLVQFLNLPDNNLIWDFVRSLFVKNQKKIFVWLLNDAFHNQTLSSLSYQDTQKLEKLKEDDNLEIKELAIKLYIEFGEEEKSTIRRVEDGSREIGVPTRPVSRPQDTNESASVSSHDHETEEVYKPEASIQEEAVGQPVFGLTQNKKEEKKTENPLVTIYNFIYKKQGWILICVGILVLLMLNSSFRTFALDFFSGMTTYPHQDEAGSNFPTESITTPETKTPKLTETGLPERGYIPSISEGRWDASFGDLYFTRLTDGSGVENPGMPNKISAQDGIKALKDLIDYIDPNNVLDGNTVIDIFDHLVDSKEQSKNRIFFIVLEEGDNSKTAIYFYNENNQISRLTENVVYVKNPSVYPGKDEKFDVVLICRRLDLCLFSRVPTIKCLGYDLDFSGDGKGNVVAIPNIKSSPPGKVNRPLAAVGWLGVDHVLFSFDETYELPGKIFQMDYENLVINEWKELENVTSIIEIKQRSGTSNPIELAFLTKKNNGEFSIHVKRIDSSDLLTEETPGEEYLLGPQFENVHQIEWNPFGTHIAFVGQANTLGCSVGCVFILDLDTGEISKISELGDGIGSICWVSPN